MQPGRELPGSRPGKHGRARPEPKPAHDRGPGYRLPRCREPLSSRQPPRHPRGSGSPVVPGRAAGSPGPAGSRGRPGHAGAAGSARRGRRCPQAARQRRQSRHNILAARRSGGLSERGGCSAAEGLSGEARTKGGFVAPGRGGGCRLPRLPPGTGPRLAPLRGGQAARCCRYRSCCSCPRGFYKARLYKV